MRRPRLPVGAVLAATLLAPGGGSAHIPTLIDPGAPVECTAGPLHAPALPGRERTLRLLVVVDGADTPAARAAAAALSGRAESPYRNAQAAPGVRFAPAYAFTSFTGYGAVRSGVLEPAPTGLDLMSQLVRWRTAHPTPAADHVHLLTPKDLRLAVAGEDQDSIVGIANCTGSIGRPAISFSISQTGTASRTIGGLAFAVDADAKVMAHEIGHAFGAAHHHANCAEGAPALLEARGEICTLMFNDIGLAGPRFGLLEAAVVASTAAVHLAS